MLSLAIALMILPASAQNPAYESPWSVPPDVAPLNEEVRVSLAAQLERGVASRNAGDFAAAVTAFQALIRPSEETYGPDHPVTATFRFQLGSALAGLGRDVEAEPHLRRALATFDRRLGQRANPSVVAQLCSELAELLIRRRDASGDAVELAQRAVLLRGQDRWFLVQDSWNLGAALIMQNRFEEAARVGAEALQRVEQDFAGDPLLLARAQRNYGYLLDGTSHRAEAQTYLQLSIATARDYWNRATPEERRQRRAEFANLLPVGFDETPGRLADRAQQILASRSNPAAIDPAWRETVRAFASAEIEAGRRKEGHDAYRLLDRLQERMGDTSLLRNQTLWPAAMALLADGNEREAIEVLREVVELDRRGGDFGNSALYRWQLGAAYARAGRRELAQQTLTDMVTAADATGGPGSSYALQYHNLRAVVLLNGGMPAAAETAARTAWRAYQQRGSIEVSDRATQQARQASIGDTALLLVSAIWEQEGRRLPPARAAEVFEAMQDVTTSASATAVAAGGARIAAGRAGLDELAAAWLDAQERIGAIDRQMLSLTEGPQAAARAELLEARRTQERRRSEAEASLRTNFGNFFDLLLPSRAPLAEARLRLRDDEALILITPGMEIVNAYATHQGFVLAVTREGAAWARVAIGPTELRTEIAALHGQLQAGGVTRAPDVGPVAQTLAGTRGYDRARAHRLYQAIFGAPEIASLIGGKARWTLSVQGVLLSAPLAALVTAAPAGGAAGDADPAMLRDTHWLGLERSLSLTPSVSTMVAQRRDAQTAVSQPRIAFFGLGDPAFDGEPGEARAMEMRAFFTDRSANVAAVRALRRLPATRAEIEQLAAAFGAQRDDYVLDVAATESEVYRRDRDGRLARAEVIAFATHGLMAGDLAQSLAEPALALTPPTQASETDDGLLTASEAARLRLNARWVILSACNTAAGGQPDSEGFTGLARAFFYAGARTLLVSQWPVNDAAAQRLTTRAVELQRSERLTAAEAMRRSMAELAGDASRDAQARSLAHPSAWAPFILVSGE